MSRTAELHERALQSLPGGVSRNTVLRNPHPLYAERGEGCRVRDIEGVERLDFANNMAALIHGHAHPVITEAVARQLKKGTAFALATEVEIRFAEHLLSRNPAFDRIRFVNSGTEAVMAAVKASRAFTGRSKIAKMEGAYHGQYDYAEVSQTANPGNWGSTDHPHSVPVARGTPPAALADVVVIPFNDSEAALSILNEHKGELACVLMDLMPHRVGMTPADAQFVATIREWTRQDGSLMVLDEVITFRTEVGGMQTRYAVTPDLTAMGKIIGGGFPVGAITGSGHVMEVLNPLADKVLFPHSGTFSANPITMTAGLAAMLLYDEAAVAHVNALGQRARAGIGDAIRKTGIEACVTGTGSMLRVHLKPSAPQNYREAYTTPEESRRLLLLLDHLFEQGFMMINTCSAALSTAMGNEEIDALVAAMENGFLKVLAEGE